VRREQGHVPERLERVVVLPLAREAHGQEVEDLGLDDLLEAEALLAALDVRVLEDAPGERDVVRVERMAVVPEDPAAEVEREHGPPLDALDVLLATSGVSGVRYPGFGRRASSRPCR
jgi:hypothetical protein